MRKVVPTFLILLALLVVGGPAHGALMAIWDFGPDAPHYTEIVTTEYIDDVPALAVMDGQKDDNGKDGVAYTDAAGAHHEPGQAAAWDDVSVSGPTDAQWIMTINTTGWWNLVIRWDYWSDATGGNQGPTSFDLAYRINGQNWIRILNDENMIRDDDWHEFSRDLSDISAIENHGLVQLRVNDLDENDLDGVFKFDNLEITGVPEPATVALLGLGVLVLAGRRRR